MEDGLIVCNLSYCFSGPESIKMVGALSPKVHLTDLKPGTYVIKLTVTDDKKLTGSDTVKIHVKKSKSQSPKLALSSLNNQLDSRFRDFHYVKLDSRLIFENGSCLIILKSNFVAFKRVAYKRKIVMVICWIFYSHIH